MSADAQNSPARRTLISPSYTAEKMISGHINDAADIYEDRVHKWLFEPAARLLETPHGDLPALTLISQFFEPFAQYFHGDAAPIPSGARFIAGFRTILGTTKVDIPSGSTTTADEALDDFLGKTYNGIRCGLFHDGMVRSDMLWTTSTKQGEARHHEPILRFHFSLQTGKTLIAWFYVDRIHDSCVRRANSFLEEVRKPDNSDVRGRFVSAWNRMNPMIPVTQAY